MSIVETVVETAVSAIVPGAGIGLKLLSAAKGVGTAIGAAAEWVFKSPFHVALIAAALIGAHDARVTYLLAHRDAALAAVPAQLAARDKAWAGPFNMMRDATLSLLETVARQNAAVLSLARDSQTRIAGQQAALSAATARGQVLQTYSYQIKADAARRAPSGKACATSPAIMAAQGKL